MSVEEQPDPKRTIYVKLDIKLDQTIVASVFTPTRDLSTHIVHIEGLSPMQALDQVDAVIKAAKSVFRDEVFRQAQARNSLIP